MITEWYQRDSGEMYGRMLIRDVRQEGNTFFPLHAMKFTTFRPLKGEPFTQVREMKVLELDTGYEPTEQDLSILLPRTAQFSDGLDSNTSKTIYRKSDTKFVEVGAHEIEKIYHDLQEIAEGRVEKQAAVTQRREIGTERGSSKISILVIVNGILLFLILGAYLIKRQRGKNV
jgi:hypothetical protein